MTFLTFTRRQTILRFRVGIAAAIASFALCIAIVIQLHHILGGVTRHGLVIVQTIVQAVSALVLCIACISIPRRPFVEVDEKPVDRQKTVSALSYILLAWSWDVLNIARAKQDLKVDDLPLLHHKTRSSYLLQWYGSEADKRALWRTLLYMNSAELAFQTLFAMLSAAIQFAPQLLLYQILRRLEDAEERPDPVDMSFLVVGLGITVILSSWGDTWNDWIGFSRIGIPTYAGLAALVFAKSTRRKDVKESEKAEKKSHTHELGEDVAQDRSFLDVKQQATASGSPVSEDDEHETTRQSTINLVVCPQGLR